MASPDALRPEQRSLKGSQMKPIKIMSFVTGLFLTAALVPPASAQTQPAPATQAQPAQQDQAKHPKASGAAKGAVIGGAMGNAGAGAVLGAGHSRREARRSGK